MKRKVFFIFMFITSLFFVFNHTKVFADSSTFEIEGLRTLEADEKQYTNKRTIRINFDIDEVDKGLYSSGGIAVCQLGSSVSTNIIEGTCRDFPIDVEKIDFQISDYGDGEKFIGTFFKSTVKVEMAVKSFVLDTQGPQINVVGDRILKLKKGSNFSVSACSAIDEYEGETACTLENDEVSTQTYGAIYNVVYSARDFLGNTSIYTQTIIIEDKPAWQPNIKILVGVILGVILIAVYIYIKIWQKKEKQKKREEVFENKFNNSKLL